MAAGLCVMSDRGTVKFGGSEVPKRDFGLIREKFGNLVIAMGNRLDRQWPQTKKYAAWGGGALILGQYKLAENYLAASRFLLADKPEVPSRKLEFALANPPLARTLLDALCTVVFLFEDFGPRVEWHYKAGWLDVRRETDRMKEAYGNDPDWIEALANREAFLEEGRRAFGITDKDLVKPKKLQFPTPDAMLRDHLTKGTERYEYVQYMIDWFYRELSQDTHLTFTGVGRAYALLIPGDMPPDERKHRLELVRFKQVSTSFILMMCLITELELQLRFGEAELAKYVWTILSDWHPSAKEIYERFYEKFLGTAKAQIIGSGRVAT